MENLSYGGGHTQVLWFDQIHKASYPLRPIVSNIGAVTYELARLVAGIISPPVGQTEHHLTNTQVFVEKIHDLKLEPDESIVSFDVSALFTSISAKEAMEVVRELLERDDSWKSGEAETLETEDVIQLLSFCPSTTYFVFRETFYQQKDGCAMGSPCIPLVANAYMEFKAGFRVCSSSASHMEAICRWYILCY